MDYSYITDEMREKLKLVSSLLKSINTENRLLIICYLVKGSKTVGEITNFLQISQPSTSQMLIKMKKEGILTSAQKSQTVYYNISNSQVIELFHTICNLYNK